MHVTIDLRSDTVTRPTPEMRHAIANAIVGDDVFGDDPTVNELEALAAECTGKPAALFLPSGTMANQVAIKSHTQPMDEVIVGYRSHIFNYEVGGLAFHSGVQANPIQENGGMLPLHQVQERIRERNIHYPRSSLVCIENTHNLEGGVPLPIDYCRELYSLAKENGLALHMDGARLFNASAATGIPIKEFCAHADSVMICLSKGLGAPMGSMLVGSQGFINRARKIRKSFGGGIRQGGIVAAAGIIALKRMYRRLNEDHRRCRELAVGLSKMKCFKVNPDLAPTNILYAKYNCKTLDIIDFETKLAAENILLLANHPQGMIRMVTHYDVDDDDIKRVLTSIANLMKDCKEE